MKQVLASIFTMALLSTPALTADLYQAVESYKVYELNTADSEGAIALNLKFDFIFDGCNYGTLAPKLTLVPETNTAILEPNLSMTKAICRLPAGDTHQVLTRRFVIEPGLNQHLRILTPRTVTIEIIKE